jgi:hypothetical protein
MNTKAYGDGSENADYKKIVDTLRRKRSGVTVADVVAASGVPLVKARELVPLAADEFSARLQVTESSEILYTFPHAFKSRYKGFGPAFRRVAAAVKSAVKTAAIFLFKVWIMVMLVGYFVLFIALALAAVLLSVVASNSGNKNSSRRSSGGGSFFVSGMLNTLIRIWF